MGTNPWFNRNQFHQLQHNHNFSCNHFGRRSIMWCFHLVPDKRRKDGGGEEEEEVQVEIQNPLPSFLPSSLAIPLGKKAFAAKPGTAEHDRASEETESKKWISVETATLLLLLLLHRSLSLTTSSSSSLGMQLRFAERPAAVVSQSVCLPVGSRDHSAATRTISISR